MTSSSLRGFICKSIPIPHPTPLHHRHQRVAVVASMADASKKQQPEQELAGEKNKKKEEEVVLPSPPEKPLPGDCCGSGCVRCVWDVYYDELEEYNNSLLLLQHNKSNHRGSSLNGAAPATPIQPEPEPEPGSGGIGACLVQGTMTAIR